MAGGQRLKLKDTVRYRSGGTSASCSSCNYFVGDFRRHGLGGVFIAVEPRCRVLGAGSAHHSIKYRVNPKNLCDRFDGSLGLLRLLGERRFGETYGEERLAKALEAQKERDEFQSTRQY